MSLVYGNIGSRLFVGRGGLTFLEVEVPGDFGEGVQGQRRRRLSW